MDQQDLGLVSDTDLMRQVQTGQPEQFAELIRRYEGPLRRVARSRLGRGDWAEEVVQETFLAAFKSRRTFDPRFSFRTWLWTILLNQCHGHWKVRQRRPRIWSWADVELEPELSDPGWCVPESREQGPQGQLLAGEKRELLERLLGQLRPAQADALRLRFYGELKFQEIADTMGCSLLPAKNRVQAGLLQMSRLVESQNVMERAPTRPADSTSTGLHARGAL